MMGRVNSMALLLAAACLFGLCAAELRSDVSTRFAHDRELRGPGEHGKGNTTEFGKHGKHGKGNTTEHGIHESKEVQHINLAVAMMLLGAMVFIMGTFYMVNHEDEDMKNASWSVISSTISIFVAVLNFHAITAIIEEIIDAHAPEDWVLVVEVVVDGFIFFMWFCLTHIFIAWEAIWFGRDEDTNSELEEHPTKSGYTTPRIPMEAGSDEHANNRHADAHFIHETGMICWATLLAHITAFAGIHWGARIQHLPFFAQSWWRCLLVVPIILLVEFVLFRISEIVRNRGDDDEGLLGNAEATDMWDEVGEEAEFDIMKLSLSFITVSAMRFGVSGVLPSAHGTEHPAVMHPLSYVVALFGLMWLCVLITIIWVWDVDRRKRAHAESLIKVALAEGLPRTKSGKVVVDVEATHTPGLDPFPLYVWRWYASGYQMTSLCFAWCFLFGTKWEQVRIPWSGGEQFSPDSTTACVVAALFVHMLSFVMLFVLDKIADQDCTTAVTDNVIRFGLMPALGLMIGFAWEQSFGSGLEIIAHLSVESKWFGGLPPPWVMLGMAVVVSFIVVPQWRAHILPKMLQHKHAAKKRILKEAADAASTVDYDSSEE